MDYNPKVVQELVDLFQKKMRNGFTDPNPILVTDPEINWWVSDGAYKLPMYIELQELIALGKIDGCVVNTTDTLDVLIKRCVRQVFGNYVSIATQYTPSKQYIHVMLVVTQS
jgi:hypothetical protein